MLLFPLENGRRRGACKTFLSYAETERICVKHTNRHSRGERCSKSVQLGVNMPTVCRDGFAAPPLKRLLQAVLAGGSRLIQTVGGHPLAHKLLKRCRFWHAFLPDEPFWNGFVESGRLSGCTNRLSGILCEEWGRFGNSRRDLPNRATEHGDRAPPVREAGLR